MRAAVLIGLLGGLAVALVARERLDVVEVRGRSMTPALYPGDRVVVVRAPPRVGDVVLAADPRAADRELIKRVAGAAGGDLYLRGDNTAASTDARDFGALPHDAVRWRAAFRYWPPSRIGAVRRAARSRPGAIRPPSC